MPLPQTKKQLRSFMGTISFYRKFIDNLATMASPLTDLLKKGLPDKLTWSDNDSKCFAHLKDCLTKSPVLQLPDNTKLFHLRTDASNTALGAILLQYCNDKPMPVAYASRKLLPREQNYATVEKECLSIVWAINKFHRYLYGREFVIETDHQPLIYLKTMKSKNDRLMRWTLELQTYKFRIVYIKGKK
jgi:hypothetical protein